MDARGIRDGDIVESSRRTSLDELTALTASADNGAGVLTLHEREEMRRQTVLILGGGAGGLVAANALRRRL